MRESNRAHTGLYHSHPHLLFVLATMREHPYVVLLVDEQFP
jgi:hypothetical protein